MCQINVTSGRIASFYWVNISLVVYRQLEVYSSNDNLLCTTVYNVYMTYFMYISR